MGSLRLRTIGVHPLTDALQLHSLVDALHSYGLDERVTVEPREGYHELVVPEDLRERVGYALVAYLLKLILKEALLLRREGKGKHPRIEASTVVKALRKAEDLARGTGQAPAELRRLSDSIIKHLSKRHPLTLELRNLCGKRGKLEQPETLDALREVINDKAEALNNAKRLIAVLPMIGKYHYINAKVRGSGSQKFDPACGRFVRAGLKLALRYPVRGSEQNYGIGVALATPSSSVAARDVWRAQAALRVFRRRWVKRINWGKAHATLMLIDAFRLSKAFSEEAAGYLVEVILVNSRGKWKSPANADELGIFHVTGVEDMEGLGGRLSRYRQGVNVAAESVTQVYPALRLARELELLGGSVDWFIDGFVRRYYMVRRGNELVLNYAFTSRIVKAVTEYDVESLYLALRSASVVAGGKGEALISDPYQLERLVMAIESLASRAGG